MVGAQKSTKCPEGNAKVPGGWFRRKPAKTPGTPTMSNKSIPPMASAVCIDQKQGPVAASKEAGPKLPFSGGRF